MKLKLKYQVPRTDPFHDSYWGFGGGTKSQADWYAKLQSVYNQETGKNRTDPIPGYTGKVQFVDVAGVGMSVFDLRKTNSVVAYLINLPNGIIIIES